MLDTRYALSGVSPLGFDETVERVRSELGAEGFGVLCDLDVQATLEAKLGVECEPYVILGACNPPLAHRALEAEPDLGVLLPCNVVVYELAEAVHVSAVDPERMLGLVENTELEPIATDVRDRLRRVVDRVVAG
jgi:uncharacterized protein (DUF302 family)